MKKLASLILMSSFLVPTAPAFALDQALVRQCLTDVCGAEKNYLGVLAKGPFGDVVPLGVQTFNTQNLDPRMGELIKMQNRLFAETIGTAKSNSLRVLKSPLTPAQLAHFVTFGLLGKYSTASRSATQDDNGVRRIDADQLQKSMPWADSRSLAKTVEVTNAFLATKWYRLYMRLNGSSFISLKANLEAFGIPGAPDSNWEQLVPKFIEIAKRYSSTVEPLSFLPVDLELLQRAGTSPQALTADEQTKVIDLVTKIFRREALRDPSVSQAVESTQLSFTEASSVLKFNDNIELFRSYQADAALKTSSAMEVLKTCRVKANNAFAASPSPLRMRQLQKIMVQIKQAALESNKIYFSGEAKAAADLAIARASFITPPGLSEIESRIASTLDFNQTRIQQQTLAVNQLKQKKDGWKELLIGASYFTQMKSIPADLHFFATQPCYEFQTADETDRTMGFDKVEISWQSAMFLEIGASAISHELGHVVSRSVPTGKDQINDALKFYLERVCSTQNHEALDPSEEGKSAANRYSEEDWADAYAATTVKNLQTLWPYSGNVACDILVQNSPNPEIYGGLELSATSGGDVHSEAMYRVLQFHVSTGKALPHSCSALLGPEQARVVSNACAL